MVLGGKTCFHEKAACKWKTDDSLLPGSTQRRGKSVATPMDELDPGSEALLRDARKDFPAFYAPATPEDAHVMDGLILGHAAMAV